MARRLFGDKPLSTPILGYCQLEYISVTFQSKFHENAPEYIICEMADILSRGRSVNFGLLVFSVLDGFV